MRNTIPNKHQLRTGLLLLAALLVFSACGATIAAGERTSVRAGDEAPTLAPDRPVWNGNGGRMDAHVVPLPSRSFDPPADTHIATPAPTPTPPAVIWMQPTPTPMPALCIDTAGTSVIVQGKEIALHEDLCIAERDEEAGEVRIQVMGGRSFVALVTATGRQTVGMLDWAEVDLFEHFEPLVGPLPRSTPAPVPPKELPRR